MDAESLELTDFWFFRPLKWPQMSSLETEAPSSACRGINVTKETLQSHKSSVFVLIFALRHRRLLREKSDLLLIKAVPALRDGRLWEGAPRFELGTS